MRFVALFCIWKLPTILAPWKWESIVTEGRNDIRRLIEILEFTPLRRVENLAEVYWNQFGDRRADITSERRIKGDRTVETNKRLKKADDVRHADVTKWNAAETEVK